MLTPEINLLWEGKRERERVRDGGKEEEEEGNERAKARDRAASLVFQSQFHFLLTPGLHTEEKSCSGKSPHL